MGQVPELPGNDALLGGEQLLDGRGLGPESGVRLERVGWTCVHGVRKRADFTDDENRVFLRKQLDCLDDLWLKMKVVSF